MLAKVYVRFAYDFKFLIYNFQMLKKVFDENGVDIIFN